MTARSPSTAPIKPAQRTALFAAARARGMDIDAIRAMTPHGSISRLTVQQAADVLERINGGQSATFQARPRRDRQRGRAPRGVVRLATAEQRAEIDRLRAAIDREPQWIDQWLAARHLADGRPVMQFRTTGEAGTVIGLLNRLAEWYPRVDPRADEPLSAPPVAQPPPAVSCVAQPPPAVSCVAQPPSAVTTPAVPDGGDDAPF